MNEKEVGGWLDRLLIRFGLLRVSRLTPNVRRAAMSDPITMSWYDVGMDDWSIFENTECIFDIESVDKDDNFLIAARVILAGENLDDFSFDDDGEEC